ncbi:uncharacterized protein (TIGR00288 family) [Sphingobium sp. OAS761]|uniref:NYN domain-containing protein n=1 Tax=Sphingobium sp. OAS761 TaxID=2817901 RepID=UPI00209D4A88|nr:NYN domain-containing protein [Sphingobium sp. OAS761]MCP1469720.1 uncharacterized protein (TIGR00288 family) [Sphingobium sp. OAS761]
MASEVQSGNVALLIDADNVSAVHFDAVLTVLAEFGTVNIRRAYGNWKKPALKRWEAIAVEQAIMTQQQFDLTKGKNATDMKMTIDAMDLMATGRITGFGLMSSDSDFTPLVTRIRQDGIPVYGFGSAKTPLAFQNACTRFIDLEQLEKTQKKSSAALDEPAVPGADPQSDTPVGPELKTLLIDAYGSVKRDEKGFARLADVGRLAGNRSSFDVRNYGFKRLSDLARTLDYFKVETRDGESWIKRIR